MWIFGYGSLTWKVDFPIEKKLNGYIRGYKRRFYQHSIDHRGVPDQPGRVVTLLPSDPDDRVYGVAYYISPSQESSTMAHLDYREKDGYRKFEIMFYPCDLNITPFMLTIYIATESNKCYAGPAEIGSIAKQIATSHGPSGSNKEYLLNLASTMRSIAPNCNDPHLFELEELVLKIDQAENSNDDDRSNNLLN